MSELAKVFRARFSTLVKHEPLPGVTYPEVLMVDGAGHSVQGDRPLELATIIADRLAPGS